MKRILVLGGTGFVGRSLCERLVERTGARILVPSRRPARDQTVRTLPALDLVQADVHDDATLAGLVSGADAVVNLVAILHGSARAFEQVHVALPRRLAAACRDSGCRLVHVSALGVGRDAPSQYLRSKWAGEEALRTAGAPLTILRPSLVFGAGDRALNLFAKLQAYAPIVPLAGSASRYQPVWVEDVASAIVHALVQRIGLGQVYEAVGPRVYTLGELVRLAGRWSGHERPQIALPGFAAWLQALVMEALPGEPLLSRDNLASMRVPSIASGTLPDLRALGVGAAALEAVAPGYLSPYRDCARLERWRGAVAGR
ncbi:MAG: complex I NDUFA9 subunit family protein [Proteobacteria bacterium]|nr:complex I NDUFA9 subunit family protein [Pseudomonadota bacterium]HOL37475.1 complex I NDUFA9 subunit family protein [Rubrivivax sp.]